MPDEKLTPADRDDLAQALSFALRFDGRKRFRRGDESMADITADHLIRHLDRCGYAVMQKPPAAGSGQDFGRIMPPRAGE